MEMLEIRNVSASIIIDLLYISRPLNLCNKNVVYMYYTSKVQPQSVWQRVKMDSVIIPATKDPILVLTVSDILPAAHHSSINSSFLLTSSSARPYVK